MLEVVLGVLIAVFVFLAMRELVLWYWRVNHIVKALERNSELLETIARNTAVRPTAGAPAPPATMKAKCPSCGHEWRRPQPAKGDTFNCPDCGQKLSG